MRVMEDAARFAINDAVLSESLKNLRHDFRAVIDALQPTGGGWLEANRDVTGDVGTSISTEPELDRRSLLDVVVAAGKRLTESLRVIEELSKIPQGPHHASGSMDFDSNAGPLSSRIESLRYRAYEIDAELQLRFGSGRATQWTLCLVLTRSLCKHPWSTVLRDAIAAGVDCVQVREKDMDAGALVQHVREVIVIAKPHAAVIVNDRVDIALAAGADGVHLGQDDLSIRDVRRIAGRSLIVGASAHDMDEARAAVEAGADYCGVGTMFASMVKPEREPTGPELLQQFIERFPHTPHVAIGGVTPANIELLRKAGCQGVAVSSAICAATEPGRIVHALREALASSRPLSASTV